MTTDAGPLLGSTESPAAERAGRRDSVSVLVVDDSQAFRRGMGRAVQAHAGLRLGTELQEARQVARTPSREKDVLL